MRNLLYKELKLSIHPFFLILPILLGLLMFIPHWIYTLVFMYFFWITASQIYSGYIAKQDHSFNAMLPVSKKEIVQSKIYALMIIEGAHLFFGLFFGVIHNLIYGQWNFFLDINIAFVGLMVLLFSIFNVVFLPLYFRTGYNFGKPVIYANVVVLIYGFIIEFSVAKYQFARDIFEGELGTQVLVLVVSLLLSIILGVFYMKKSINNFEKIY